MFQVTKESQTQKQQLQTPSFLLMTLIWMLPRNGLAPRSHLFVGLFKSFYICTRFYLAGEPPLIFLLFGLMIILVIYESSIYAKSTLGLIKLNSRKLTETKIGNFYKFLLAHARNADDVFIIQPNYKLRNTARDEAKLKKHNSARSLLSLKEPSVSEKITVQRLSDLLSEFKSNCTTSPSAATEGRGIITDLRFRSRV